MDAFEKLQEAYVKVRDIQHFHIERGQLEWLGERAVLLTQRVKQSCREHLAGLGRVVENRGTTADDEILLCRIDVRVARS